MKEKFLEIAQLIGEPIDPNLPVPFELSKIAFYDTADAGEKVYTFNGEDSIVDEVYVVNADGTLSYVKENLLGEIEIPFVDLNTPLKYLSAMEVLRSVDETKLSRIKASITRSFDKQEAYLVLKAINDSPLIEEITPDVDEDLYDVLARTLSVTEDYGDGFVLLAGTDVYKKINMYDKEKAGTFNYKVGLKDFLKESGVEVIKVFEKIKNDDGTVKLLDPKRAILVATNSRIAEGKPIVLVRRKFDAALAKNLGVDVDGMQRALIMTDAPMNVPGTGNVIGFGLAGVESIALAILNTRVIKKLDLSTLV